MLWLFCLVFPGVAFSLEKAFFSPLTTFSGIGEVQSLAFSQDGRYLAAGNKDGHILIYDLRENGKRLMIRAAEGEVNSLSFDPDGRFLISAGGGRKVQFWDYKYGRSLGEYEIYRKKIHRISISRNGGLLAGAADDENIVLWDIDSKMVYAELKGHRRYIHSLAFHPDGETLVSAGLDKNIITWDLRRRLEKRRMSEPAAEVGKITKTVFGPDGLLLATAVKEIRPEIEGKRRARGGIKEIDHIQVRDNRSGESIARFDGHLETINELEFSPDGRYIASASDDHSVMVWDIEAADRLTVLDVADRATHVAFSPNGRYLAAAVHGGCVMVWKVANVCPTPVYVAKSRRYCPALEYLPEFKGDPCRVAVVGLEAKTGLSQEKADLLQDVLQNALLRTGRFELIERRKVKEIVKEQRWQISEYFNEETVVEPGNLAGAEELLVGTVGRIKACYVVELRFIDVATGKVLRTVDQQYEGDEEDLFLLIQVAANRAAKEVTEKKE